ncbi:UNVERIFIED_CONTAM: Retrovirus-related Pol polyprotein from transposon TNT 1-94 [Sesamum latifolium]|uniref:Retrovirus-related Pol polyprotein from transposon TNT 1-94 n=1 Tax=Sesamum latifolium TaxID=2727402 RepID=A0AAW2SSI7_9LAMI
MIKKPFVGQSAIPNDLLDLVYTDVCGPLSIPARGGFSYFITFTDDHSRYGYIYLMRYKSEAFGRFKEYRLEVENQTNRKIKALRSDRAVMFLEKDFPSDNRRDEVLIEESSGEPQLDSTKSFEPTVHTDSVPVLRRSTRESRVPERYGFIGLTSQLDNDPKTYGEAMSDIDSDKWLEAMKSEMDSMMDVKTAFLNGFVEEEIFMDQRRVSPLLEKNRKSVVSKGPSTASSKLPEAGTRV